MANVFKRAGTKGKASWYIRYQDHTGKDVRRKTGARTKREAEAILISIMKDLEDRTYEVKQKQREVTFFEICEDFLTYSLAHKRSWRRDIDNLNNMKGFFGDCLIIDIKPSRIEQYISYRKNSLTPAKRPPTPATINREISCLRTIFNKAIHNGKCEKNPMRFVKLLKENNIRNRILSKEEYKRLLDVSPEHLKPVLVTAYETGMRLGEILSLTWDLVDLERGFIYLQPEMTKLN